MKMLRNTDKVFHCTNCGGEDCNIVREGPDPKLKCNSCNFVFLASDSKAAEEAGVIPEGPPRIDSNQREPAPEIEIIRSPTGDAVGTRRVKPGESVNKSPWPPPKPMVPHNVKYVFVSKDRKNIEFITGAKLKKTMLAWESKGTKYELFELQPKKSRVKIDIE